MWTEERFKKMSLVSKNDASVATCGRPERAITSWPPNKWTYISLTTWEREKKKATTTTTKEKPVDLASWSLGKQQNNSRRCNRFAIGDLGILPANTSSLLSSSKERKKRNSAPSEDGSNRAVTLLPRNKQQQKRLYGEKRNSKTKERRADDYIVYSL